MKWSICIVKDMIVPLKFLVRKKVLILTKQNNTKTFKNTRNGILYLRWFPGIYKTFWTKMNQSCLWNTKQIKDDPLRKDFNIKIETFKINRWSLFDIRKNSNWIIQCFSLKVNPLEYTNQNGSSTGKILLLTIKDGNTINSKSTSESLRTLKMILLTRQMH